MKKQNLWTRDELIVALHLYWGIPYNKISGTSNQKIQNFASLIGRKPAAVAFKLMNFTSIDPERQRKGNRGKTSAGKLDKIIWNEYFNQWEKLSYDSTILLAKLQNKKPEEIFDIDNELKALRGFDIERIVKTRVNQNDFRNRILASYDEKCCITGINIKSLLVASHIIPWSKNKKERLNPQNGLCLNSIHDKAFDDGLITISTDYKVVLSEILLSKINDLSIQKFFIGYENFKITLPNRYIPDREFLHWHNTNVFQNYSDGRNM